LTIPFIPKATTLYATMAWGRRGFGENEMLI